MVWPRTVLVRGFFVSTNPVGAALRGPHLFFSDWSFSHGTGFNRRQRAG